MGCGASVEADDGGWGKSDSEVRDGVVFFARARAFFAAIDPRAPDARAPIAALALAHPELRRRIKKNQAPDFRSGRVRQVDALQADEDFVRDAVYQ